MSQNGQLVLLQAGKTLGLRDEIKGASHSHPLAIEDRKADVEDLPEIPWERLRYERTDAYQAFVYYRDMGVTRSIKGFADEAPDEMRVTLRRDGTRVSLKPKQYQRLIYKWSARFRWYDRAVAWDDHLMAKWTEQRERSLMQALDNNAETATKFLKKVAERLEKIEVEEIPLSHLYLYAKTFVDVQMLSLGNKERKPGDDNDDRRAPTLVQVNVLGEDPGNVQKTVTPPLADEDLPAEPS